MDTKRWKAVDNLLQSALEIVPERREEFLRQECAGDADLADEVRSLLTSHRHASGFLETPAAEMAARAIAAEAAPTLSSSRTGQLISHYRLLKIIGSGGMGSVWLAERCDGRFERKVAIKFIHLAVLDDAGAERFKREGAILGKLSHPQIAELLDAGLTASGEPFLALEYVEGVPIDAYCNDKKLDVEARIRLFLDVLSAVAHAHSNLIVHRDIKPTNVLIRNDGEAKLLDFGIAKVLADESEAGDATWLTMEGGAALTPLFAAPEQLSQGTITTATDIYSLGVLLYILLTGQHPAGPGPHSAAQLIKTIVDQESPRASVAVSATSTDAAAARSATPERLRRQLRGDLDRIIAKSIKKNPAERYTSVGAFADDLRRYLEHEPVLARPDSVGYRMAKFVRRNRVAVALAALAFIAVSAGVTWIVIQNRKVRAERDFAFRQLRRGEEHDDFLDFLLSDAAPSGKPFTVNDLLGRATQIVERQKPSPTQVELLDWIGVDYSAQDQHGLARPILERAYQQSRQSTDPGIRASTSCTLGFALARDEDLTRSESLIQEGLRELPDDPEYALNRVTCLRQGSFVSRERGQTDEAVNRMEAAQRILRASPFDSDSFEMSISLDLSEAFSEAGRDQQALAEFQRAGALMSALGRDETQTAVVLYNNWALELDQLGRPLEAEKIFRRVIDISRDNSSEEAVSPMVLTNYARVQRILDHLDRAADYAERAHSKAVKTGDELVISQSLLELARIYREQHDLVRAEAMIAEAEPRLHKDLPPGHYAFAAITTERSLIALQKHDLPTALRLMDQSIAMIEAAVKAGGEGAFSLPGLYTYRSEIDLAMGHADQAAADADHALAALQSNQSAGDVSSKVGRAYLAQARALASGGKAAAAHAAAAQALTQLEASLGPNHPDTAAARLLAQ
jgi:serine/threonine protein kinase